jgi:hypothetical protein
MFFIHEVSYTSSICPYVFINSKVVILGFYEITNSFIFKNRLEFMNVDDDISFFNHTNINGPAYLLINIVFEELTTKILCPNVFKNLQYFTIIGSPSSIQSNLFEPFKKIEYLMFNMDNLKTFFQRGLEKFLFTDELKCTCTLIWLIQNYKIFFYQNFSSDIKLKNHYEIYIKHRNVTRCLNNDS